MLPDSCYTKRVVCLFYNLLREDLVSLSILLVSVCLKNICSSITVVRRLLCTHIICPKELWCLFFFLPVFHLCDLSACEQDGVFGGFVFSLTVPYINWLLVSLERKLARDFCRFLSKISLLWPGVEEPTLICVLLWVRSLSSVPAQWRRCPR